MENMATPYLEAQLLHKNVKPMDHSLRKLSNEGQAELMKWIKPCYVILDVLEGKQNFKVRCLIHNRYECTCINRNQRWGRKKNYKCKTKQNDTSQQKQKKKKKSFNCVNKQFSEENSDILECDWLFEEDKDICKVSNETLFTDNKDIDYHLVRSVKIEQDVEGSSRENDISVQNVDAPLFHINDICTSNDRPSLTTNQIHPKIKEEIDNYEQVSIINESVISIELYPVSKVEGLQDISENSMPVSDKSCSDDFPDNSNNNEIETKNVCIVQKPFKATEAVQREMETNLQLQNKVQTINWTLQSDPQIKVETNSRDYDATVGEEEYVNKLSVADKNMQLKSRNDEMFQNQSNENSKSNVDQPFGYTICEKAFTQQPSVIKHKCIHTREKPFGCTICGKAFAQKAYLTKHERIHTGDIPFGCSICGKAFIKMSHLITHKRIHTGEKPFGCTICGKAFIQQSYIIRHKRIHSGEKPFGCTECGKAFSEQCSLTRHKRLHTTEKPFGCTECGKAFKEQTSLIRHKRLHTGEKPFGCTECGKAFIEQTSLTRHKRLHSVEKPFGCSICGKKFTERTSLIIHIRIHTREKPFGCTICGKAFTAQANLSRHKRIHTRDMPFGCTICGKAFTDMSNLTRHKRIHT